MIDTTGRGTLSLLISLALYMPLLGLIFYAKPLFEPIEKEPLTILPLAIFEETARAVPSTPQTVAPASATAAPIVAKPPQTAAGTNGKEEQNASETLSIAELNSLLSSQPSAEAGEQTEGDRRNMPTVSSAALGDLYGLMLYELTRGEREFLEQHLNPIQTITQRYLNMRGYPYLAVAKRMTGEVILAFTLLPNGDITPIEQISSSGWSLIDSHAVETIKAAYKDYPRPDEPVRVRMRVIYKLY
ncbi:hypothetical protein AGMMS50229_12350 [Campylobacterota bacterium]|nr:hypothetical protein AGMMS50229_12350 [Campylobacterota bacterium]